MVDLANLESNVDKLDIDKIKNILTKIDKLDASKLLTVPVDLSKLSDVGKNDLVKKNVYNTKIKNIANKIPGITNLATTTALTGIENEMLNVSNLVKKTDYNTKIIEIQNKITANYDHDKHVTTQEFDKLTSENFTAKLKQANLASKNDATNFAKKR